MGNLAARFVHEVFSGSENGCGNCNCFFCTSDQTHANGAPNFIVASWVQSSVDSVAWLLQLSVLAVSQAFLQLDRLRLGLPAASHTEP